MTQELMNWYDQHQRILPWRGIHDPYKTWVSEIMLQQTRVDTVIPYFIRFVSTFPDVKCLASAQIEHVLKLWEGLGYYRRARNLQKGAIQVMKEYNGIIPSDPALLQTICGIGHYTAGAISSIAFNVSVPAVDGNVIRVFSRYFGIIQDVSQRQTLNQIEQLDCQYMDHTRPGDYNQAIMDLGATICIPGTPSCSICPLRFGCKAYHDGNAQMLPNIPDKPQPKPLYFDLFLIQSEQGILMRQRSEKMLEGLWTFPMVESAPSPTPAIPYKLTPDTPLVFCGEARHVFTHQIWHMKVYFFNTRSPAPRGYSFIPYISISDLALPSAMNKPLEYLQKRIR